MKHEKIGLFGGTFDPPHLGHMILASEAFSQLQLDRLLWILTPSPPHKQNQVLTSTEHRLAMVKLAIQDNPNFQLSSLELDRPGPHFTIDTVIMIAEQYPNTDIIPIIGGDSLRDLPSWRRPKDLVDACHRIGVMRRPGHPEDLATLEIQIPGISSKIQFVDAPLLEIASRSIRNRITEGRPFQYYLLPSVYEYILTHHLYKRS